MSGSTIIFESDASRLLRLSKDIDELDDFVHVELDLMLTLDFESMCIGPGLSWVAGSPVVLDEQAGLAIFPVSEPALSHVLSQAGEVDEDLAPDLERLSAFVARYGSRNLYEMTTF